MNATAQRPVDRWFASYSGDHVNETNQLIHVFAVPAILWTVVALLWCIPFFGRSGVVAGLIAFGTWAYYFRLSPSLSLGMLFVFFSMLWLTRWLESVLGLQNLFFLAVAVFVLAWIAQFIGHKIEGKKPSFLTDITYLLIGPVWVLSKFYRKMGWRY